MDRCMNTCQQKTVSADYAMHKIKSGDRIVVGHACGEPSYLVDKLVELAPELSRVEIVHMVPMGQAKYAQIGMEESFRHNSLFVGSSTRKAIEEKRGDFTPCFFSEIPRLFKESILPVDIALIQVTPPDEQGYCSLGLSADYTVAAAANAKTVIAQVNKKYPRTFGARIHVSEVDYFVEKDEHLKELAPPSIGDIEKHIGENVSKLIPDGATLQLGIGAIPDAVLLFLRDKRDLGIHSEMFSDGVVTLAREGVITNKKKNVNEGKFIASFLMGTAKLYEFVHNNPDIEMHPVDYVNDPCLIGMHDNMISINSALQVDLMGQVNAEMIGSRQFSAIGGQIDFVRGSSRSKGGKSIIALPSTASGGKISRITCLLDQGAAVSTSRNDVHYIVTEYGIANLRGKTLRERANALINIAHPDYQSAIYDEAKRYGMI